MGVAWAACLVLGFALGALACLMLAGSSKGAPRRRRAARPARRPSPARQDPRLWCPAAETVSNDTLSLLRRLAVAPDPPAATAAEFADALDAYAARFGVLRDSAPDLARRRGLVEQCVVARRGARAEAARLRGAIVAKNERPAFLAALRSLRDATRVLTAAPRATASERPIDVRSPAPRPGQARRVDRAGVDFG